MPEVTVLVLARAKPGRGDEGVAAYRALAAATHEEEGCLLFAVHRVPADPDRIVLIERWESRERLDAHLAAPHLVAFREGSVDVWAHPAGVLFLEPVDAGDPSKARIGGARAAG
jgi:quinol monooxygenase YgiN